MVRIVHALGACVRHPICHWVVAALAGAWVLLQIVGVWVGVGALEAHYSRMCPQVFSHRVAIVGIRELQFWMIALLIVLGLLAFAKRWVGLPACWMLLLFVVSGTYSATARIRWLYEGLEIAAMESAVELPSDGDPVALEWQARLREGGYESDRNPRDQRFLIVWPRTGPERVRAAKSILRDAGATIQP